MNYKIGVDGGGSKTECILVDATGGVVGGPRGAGGAAPRPHYPMAMLGCYSFPAHVLVRHPDVPMGIEIPTVLDALSARAQVVATAPGCGITDPDRSGIPAAVEAAREADVAIVVVGDRAGLFGRGTSGEGCDAGTLELPGVQAELLAAVLDSGTPTVLVLLTGRPYALGELGDRCAAVVQAFFPGQRGGEAVAEVLSGAVNPSGRLPVSMPAHPSGQPGTYLAARLGRLSSVSSADPTPAYPFGHGLAYTTFAWTDAAVEGVPAGGEALWPVDGEVTVGVTVTNSGAVAGVEVVQLYLHDPVAQVVQPLERLVGYARVPLEPGESARVRFVVPSDLASFTGLAGSRVVEPGDVELRLARSSADVAATLPLRLVGALRHVGHARALRSVVSVLPAPTAAGQRLAP